MKSRFLILLFILMNTTIGHCQLSQFTLDIATTDETCEGNGTVNPTVTNTTSGATIKYTVVKLPGLTLIAQYSNSSNNILTGLIAGDYRITATQTLGNQANEQEKDFTIADNVVELDFNAVLTSLIDPCTGVETAKIIVTATTGTPSVYTLYKIISENPTSLQLVAQQSSNVFTITDSFKYRVEVSDICGKSKAKDYTFTIGGGSPDFSLPVTVSPQQVLSCTQMKIEYILSDPSLSFPIDLIFTIHPSGAPDQVVTVNYPSGTTLPQSFSQVIPIDFSTIYTYDIEIKGNCSKVFNDTQAVDPNPTLTLVKVPAKCGYFLTSTVSNYTPPYTAVFTASPPGFDPTAFNPDFAANSFTVPGLKFGDIDHPVPFGTYEMKIVDFCGRTAIKNLQVIKDTLVPAAGFTNNGCLDSQRGKLTIKIPQNRKLVSAIMIAAPSAYASTVTLPLNVTTSINNAGALVLVNLPIGTYTFDLIDECGSVYLAFVITIPPYVKKGFSGNSLPNCEIDTGSLKLSSGDGKLSSVIITAAPAAYNQTLPFNATSTIDAAGNFYMNNLPAGNYDFILKDACDFEAPFSQLVEAYNGSPANISFNFVPNCGTFNLTVNDTSNGTNQMAFWLQKKDPITGAWGSPQTGVVYVDGTVPDATNSFQLTAGSTVVNLTFTGDFRILKSFTSYNAGSQNRFCVVDLGGFTFLGHLEIDGANTLDCIGGSGSSAVVIQATGVPPFNYSIVEKDGQPFVVNNGTNNVFLNLSPAVYKFEVQDACEKKPRIFDVRNLQPLVVANPVPENLDLLKCRTDDIKKDIFDLTTQNQYILGGQNPAKYEITYHINPGDADTGASAIQNPESFEGTANQIIYARIYQKIVNICYAKTSFVLYVGKEPVLKDIPIQHVCEDSTLDIGVEPGYSSYLWSTGQKTPSIRVDESGTYHVDVKNNYGTTGILFCSSSKDITVNKSSIAHFEKFDTVDWTENENSITIIVSGDGSYEYSLDDLNYQTSNVFTNLEAGTYRVYVNDTFGCGKIFKDVALLNYPKFFTPNGDGYNETWQIEFAIFEPKLMVYVYDRYGKLITGLDSKNIGWDGKYNGNPLPSTDYWFVANRADGRVYKGHFSMKR